MKINKKRPGLAHFKTSNKIFFVMVDFNPVKLEKLKRKISKFLFTGATSSGRRKNIFDVLKSLQEYLKIVTLIFSMFYKI